ncbi:MAG: ribulose-phosphate 3-epimerase [candidate division WOR-3 bacterium]
MDREIHVSVSILAEDFSKLGEILRIIEDSGGDSVHLDVIDGVFAPNITFGPVVIKGIRKLSKLPLHAHLMIKYPEKYLEDFVKAGCSWIYFHLEAEGEPLNIINKLRKMNVKSGIVLNPDTSVETVKPYLREVDSILVMSVYPGFSGQKFIPEVLKKIKELRQSSPTLDIAVDGGINDETIDSVLSAGANVIIANSYIFSSKDRAYAIRRLKGLK